MARRAGFSAQTLSVLAALEADTASWQHGYLIARETGLRSGTLYPILIRLAERGLVEACWEDEQPAGRPRRHLYRLSSDGLAAARAALAGAPDRQRRAAAPSQPGPAPDGRGGSMTRWLTRTLAILLGRLAGLLPAGRRDWGEAVLAEVSEVHGGSAQVAWLGGGLWMVAREVVMARVIGVLAFAAGVAGLVWIAWPGESSDSATPLNRVYVILTVVMLGALPWAVRRFFGPARSGWLPRAARAGGYAAVIALIAAKAVKDRDGSRLGTYFVVTPSIWVAEIMLLIVIGSYAAGLLILTSERMRAGRSSLPAGLGVGAVIALGLWAVKPLGDPTWWWLAAALPVPWAIGFATARFAARDQRSGTVNPATQGALAAVCVTATASLLLAVLTAVTIALFPHRVPLQYPAPPPNGACETCAPNSVVIPPGLRHEYRVDISIGQVGEATFAALLLGPLLGAAFGGAGAAVATRPRGSRGRSDPLSPANLPDARSSW